MYVSAKRKCLVLIILVLFPLSYISAQSKLYSLQELIDSAVHFLPVFMEKRAAINSYKALVTDTRNSFLPQLKVNDQLNIGSANSVAGAYLPIGVNLSVSAAVRGESDYRAAAGNFGVLYSEYELADFGLKSAKINNAMAGVDVQEADLQRLLYDMKTEVSRLYFNLLKNEYQLKADSQNINRYQDIYSVIKALASSGIRPGSDTSLTKAELSKAIITYNQTAGHVSSLRQQLAYWCGISADRIRIDTSALRSSSAYPLQNDLSLDTAHHPLIDLYVKQKQFFLSNEKLISKSYLPKILLAGSLWARGSSIEYPDQYKSLATGWGYQRYNYMTGVSITYDLFNSIHKRDKLAIGRFQTEASDYALQQAELSLSNAAMQADNTLKTAEANLKELPVQLKSAGDVYSQKMAQYKAGLIDLIDLTNASFVLYRSQTDYIETVSDWYLARLDKAAAVGNLDSFIQSIK